MTQPRLRLNMDWHSPTNHNHTYRTLYFYSLIFVCCNHDSAFLSPILIPMQEFRPHFSHGFDVGFTKISPLPTSCGLSFRASENHMFSTGRQPFVLEGGTHCKPE